MNPINHTEAIEAIVQGLGRVRGVRSVVLFGSAARGTATEDSDVDLFLDCEESARDRVRQIAYGISDRTGGPFNLVFYRPQERNRFDTQFLDSILRDGRPLLGKLPTFSPRDLDLEPLRLVSYRTEALRPRERARLLRILDGYRTEKRVGRKRYVVEKPGLLEKLGGWRVGRGAVVVPEPAVEAFDELLRRFRVTRSMVPIWCQRP